MPPYVLLLWFITNILLQKNTVLAFSSVHSILFKMQLPYEKCYLPLQKHWFQFDFINMNFSVIPPLSSSWVIAQDLWKNILQAFR